MFGNMYKGVYVVCRDELGNYITDISECNKIAFSDGCAVFYGGEEDLMTVPVSEIVEIYTD